MRNADMPAMPIRNDVELGDKPNWLDGLTKREHFAALTMQGLAAQVEFMFRACPDGEVPANYMADQAVGLADALLAELERTK